MVRCELVCRVVRLILCSFGLLSIFSGSMLYLCRVCSNLVLFIVWKCGYFRFGFGVWLLIMNNCLVCRLCRFFRCVVSL